MESTRENLKPKDSVLCRISDIIKDFADIILSDIHYIDFGLYRHINQIKIICENSNQFCSESSASPNMAIPINNISHLALDIGGSLIKLVYYGNDSWIEESEICSNDKSCSIIGGRRLYFVMFQTTQIIQCLDFIHSVGSVRAERHNLMDNVNWSTIKVTGGGGYKFANMFKERLGVSIEKEDEMNCLVAGANFVLQGIEKEAFTHNDGQMKFVSVDRNDLYPYLLVNIGSGVSIIKVDGDGKYERVGGSSIGGGTFVGLGKYLTKLDSFNELLEASLRGDNKNVDMLVGDIYGDRDYAKIGLSSSTIASSFGKVKNKELDDCRPEDLALSLLRMISYHIGQLAHSKAREYGLKRIFFGGFFIRGHAYTMDTISYAVQFWSKGNVEALFLRHEGFLGAIGSLISNEKLGLCDLNAQHSDEQGPTSDRCIKEKELHSSPQGDLNDKDTEEKHKSCKCLELEYKNGKLNQSYDELRKKYEELEAKCKAVDRMKKWATIFLAVIGSISLRYF